MGTRTTRFSSLFPVEKLVADTVTIIGVGGIGRPLAIALASMGVSELIIYDGDTVSEVNYGAQGYRPDQLGKKKVQALGEELLQINPELKLVGVADHFKPGSKHSEVIFCCVDKIDTRKAIWEAVKTQCSFWVDTRMAAELARILTVVNGVDTKYLKTIFPAAEAYEAPCTAKSTLYCGSLAANLAISQYTKFLREIPLEGDFTYNIFANELIFPAEQ